MNKYFIVLFVAISLLSCNSNKKEIIPRNDLVNILVDMHIMDAVVKENSGLTSIHKIDSATLYGSILKKYDYDNAHFDATLEFYSHNQREFSEIYEEVKNNISRRKTILEEDLNSFSKGVPILIWSKNNLKIAGDSVQYPQPFYIPIDTAGSYLVEASLKMTEKDMSKNPCIKIELLKDTNSNASGNSSLLENFSIYKNSHYRTSLYRNYQFKYKLENEDYKFLSITLPEVNNIDSIFKKDFEISYLHVLMDTIKKQTRK